MSWRQGERGQTGDHGQDGRPGRDSDSYEDPAINRAIAEALGEKRVRLNDRRLTIMFLFLVLGMAFGYWQLDRQADRSERADRAFRAQTINNCIQVRDNVIGFNEFVEKLQLAYDTSPVLTPEQRAERVSFFETAKQAVPTCPPPEQLP